MEWVVILFVAVFGISEVKAQKVMESFSSEAHVAKWEGFRNNAYQDVAGVWTVGYGQTTIDGRPVKQGDYTTEADARMWLQDRLEEDAAYVRKYAEAKGYDWNNYQVAALTSFVYNVGKGGLNKLTRGGLRNNEEISEALLLYNKAGGKFVQGLLNRRIDEQRIFLK